MSLPGIGTERALRGPFWFSQRSKTILKILGAILGVFLLGGVAVVGINAIGTMTSVATAPGRVVQRTMATDNIINNYEWFHQANANFQSRVSQIRVHKGLLASEQDPIERNRIRIELVGMQSSCRDIANTYNARSIMTNRSIFMGREAQPELNPLACE